jgi:arabinan endo-1,5-alpha-L-arabinosidase
MRNLGLTTTLLLLAGGLACSQSGQGGPRPGAGGSGAGGTDGFGGVSAAGGTSEGSGGVAAGATGSNGGLAAGGANGGGGVVAAGGASGNAGVTGSGGASAVGGTRSAGGATTTTDAGLDTGTARDVPADRPTDGATVDTRDAAVADLAVDPPASPVDGGACPAPGPGTFGTSTTHLDIGVHDPSMMSDGKKFYLFATGGSLSIRSSTNGLQWSNAGRVFTSVPAWVATATSATDLWAPDISFFACKYHVYYAGSTFGSNTSVIGLATSPSLDPAAAGYGWTDEGMVVQSKSSDNYNAIDPNVSYDDAGNPWLAFGSFWDGIKMRRLDPDTGKPSTTDTTLYALASRRGTGDAIEAPSIISHNGYYYLFVSFDACCKGVSSTYRTMVGRGSAITGPYTDKAGTGMSKGAAEELLASSGRYIGPGGGTAFKNGDGYYYAYHYYDGQNNGASKLAIRPVTFDGSDWPVLGDPLFP